MKSLLVLLATVALVPIESALAQVAAVVEGVQMPAWIERDGRRLPLIPGMELRPGDQVVTGAGSRIMVKLAESSLVRLGENGKLAFTELSPTRQLFKAALNVLEGAFRFTTDVVAKARKREVTIRAAQVTAGVRGTDFWGRARQGNEIVCLIDGEVEVAAAGEAPVRLREPRQFYRRIDGKTQALGVVNEVQIDRWSGEVELQTGKGIARRGGRYSVLLASAAEQSAASAIHDELENAGYAAELRSVKQGGKTLYTVSIRQLASRAEAEALAKQLRGKYGIRAPKVSG
ncbi:MAG: hypothetical protein E6H54_20290 [Betaproteobacteria bacterium]|nr:MAG: hypothetical protein E6H54_20290 [Betaproteobacteria bacterium]